MKCLASCITLCCRIPCLFHFGSQRGYLCVGTERSLLDGSAAPCCPICWQARRCPRAATQAQEETEFIRLLWLEIVQGGYDDTMTDEEISQIGGWLIVDAKGVFDATHRIESAALSSMPDKRSAVESLAESCHYIATDCTEVHPDCDNYRTPKFLTTFTGTHIDSPCVARSVHSSCRWFRQLLVCWRTVEMNCVTDTISSTRDVRMAWYCTAQSWKDKSKKDVNCT